MISDWQASIARTNIADWVTVAAYMFCALMSRARRKASKAAGRGRREDCSRGFTVALMVFLGINELLDLQTLLTMIGRAYAKANGWYAVHRSVPYAFIVTLGAVALITVTVTLWLTRRMHAAVRLALIGLILVGLSVLQRADLFHHLNEMLRSQEPRVNVGIDPRDGWHSHCGGLLGPVHSHGSRRVLDFVLIALSNEGPGRVRAIVWVARSEVPRTSLAQG